MIEQTKKIRLDEIQVLSFVTDMNNLKEDTIRGGIESAEDCIPTTDFDVIPTYYRC